MIKFSYVICLIIFLKNEGRALGADPESSAKQIAEDFRALESRLEPGMPFPDDAVDRLLAHNDPEISAKVFSSPAKGRAYFVWAAKKNWSFAETDTLARVIGSLADDGSYRPYDYEEKALVIRLSALLEKAILLNGGVAPPDHLYQSNRVSVKQWLREVSRANTESAVAPHELKEVLQRAEQWSAGMENAPGTPPPEEQPDYREMWSRGYILPARPEDRYPLTTPPPSPKGPETVPEDPPQSPDASSLEKSSPLPAPPLPEGLKNTSVPSANPSRFWIWPAAVAVGLAAVFLILRLRSRR